MTKRTQITSLDITAPKYRPRTSRTKLKYAPTDVQSDAVTDVTRCLRLETHVLAFGHDLRNGADDQREGVAPETFGTVTALGVYRSALPVLSGRYAEETAMHTCLHGDPDLCLACDEYVGYEDAVLVPHTCTPGDNDGCRACHPENSAFSYMREGGKVTAPEHDFSVVSTYRHEAHKLPRNRVLTKNGQRIRSMEFPFGFNTSVDDNSTFVNESIVSERKLRVLYKPEAKQAAEQTDAAEIAKLLKRGLTLTQATQAVANKRRDAAAAATAKQPTAHANPKRKLVSTRQTRTA